MWILISWHNQKQASDLRPYADPEGVTGGPDPIPLAILIRTPRNHKASKSTFNFGPSTARQRNAVLMGFRWRDDYDPLIVVFGSSLTLINYKTKLSKLDAL